MIHLPWMRFIGPGMMGKVEENGFSKLCPLFKQPVKKKKEMKDRIRIFKEELKAAEIGFLQSRPIPHT
uniref:Uncharacterized protein n=1 Tax=viral metagenome TaxID=1070528 RepID=A0A6M3IQS6_9ZZZZ